MNKSTRLIYVEKQKPFNVAAQNLLHELQTNLHIKGIKNIRILIKYVITGIDDQTFAASLQTIFSEPPVDAIFLEKFNLAPHTNAFAVAFLPEQFDQRADSAEQCLKLINPSSRPQVNTAHVYILEGKLSNEEINEVKRYLINPVDSHEVSVYVKKIKSSNILNVSSISTLKQFNAYSIDDLKYFHQQEKLAISLEDLILIQKFFIKEQRAPTITEIKVIDTYWSDHCRHTTFQTQLDAIKIAKGQYTDPIRSAYLKYLNSRKYVYGKYTNYKISLMDIATIYTKELLKKKQLKDLDISEENNACSINVNVQGSQHSEKYLLMFKNETHNHPTEIEPFGGAATCLGGAIRDPLSGRAFVYQAMRVTGSDNPTNNVKKIPHKLSQQTIAVGAAKGYSSYGNQIGLATGQVDEIYHPGYIAKHMEVGAVLGAVTKKNVLRQSPSFGDLIILLGGRTGKDGIGGATGSSKAHTIESMMTSGAEVQKGNPICERKIQRLFLNPKVTRLIKKCNDFGAGGVSVAIGELCPGVDINLDSVPKKYLGLNGTEIALSESQERMAVVIDKKNLHLFMQYAQSENLEATVVGNVTNSNRLRMYWQKKIIVDLDRDFLNTNGATHHANVIVNNPPKPTQILINKNNLNKQWIQTLNELNASIKLGLIQMFDSTIGANTVLLPLGGKNQLTPTEGMAALIPTFDKRNISKTISLMSFGFNPLLGEWSPFHMGYYSVIESVTKIVAMGGAWQKIYFSFQEYFQKLGNDPKLWAKPFSALLGAYEALTNFKLSAIGGKDSMSGTYEDIFVPPTLISFAVSTTTNDVISPEFKFSNSTIALVLPKKIKDGTIDINVLKKNYDVVHQGIIKKQIVSAYSLKHFGIAEGLSKMSIGNDIGVDFYNLSSKELFAINYGALIVEIFHNCDPLKVLKNSHFKIIGHTTKNPTIINQRLKINIPLNQIKHALVNKLANVYTNSTKTNNQNVKLKPYHLNQRRFSKKIIKTPLVVIPVFPGTNCEYDSQLAFERVGAKVQQVLIRNLTSKDLLNSINKLAKVIDRANIVMIPGGFSAADEPDGSAKFIVNVFRHSSIKKAINKLLNKRDGLMIGICNGFQALIKLGLLPNGKIQKMTKSSPTLTFNKISHHMSTIVRTKVVSNMSPWLAQLKPGDVHLIPISHGEGQFVANIHQIREMEKNGQITTQYVDLNHEPTMNMPYNPNGSTFAIEGISSADGRIFGKMGHSERIGKNLYRNLIGEYDQKIFASGVNYFTHKH